MLERDSEAREELLSKLSSIFFRLMLNRFAVNQEENYYIGSGIVLGEINAV